MSSLAARPSARLDGAVAVPRVDPAGVLLGLALAVGLAGAAFGGAGGIRLEDTVPVELAVTSVGTALAAGAVYTGRGPVRVYGMVTLALLAGADRLDRAVDHLVGRAVGELDRGQPHALLPGRVRRRGEPGPAAPPPLGRVRRRRAGRLHGRLRLRDADQGLPGLAGRRRRDLPVYARRSTTGTRSASWRRSPVPLCLWLGARRHGHALVSAFAYPAPRWPLVTMVLAYSRGALLRRLWAAILWFAIVPLRLRGLVVLIVSTIGAAIVLLWALNQDGLAADHIPLIVREETGSEFGVLLILMGVLIYGAGLATSFFIARHPLAGSTRRTVGTVALVAVALVPVIALGAVALSSNGLGGTLDSLTNPDAKVPSNGPDRLTATGSVRARYWRDALNVWKAAPILGAGAGAYPTVRARYRKDDIQVRHAHGYVVQTLPDLGAVGLALSLAALVAWLVAAARPAGVRLRAPWRRRGPPDLPPDPEVLSSSERAAVVAVAALVVTFGVHSLVDWTWFVPGTGRGRARVRAAGSPAAGHSTGRCASGRRSRCGLRALAAAGVALVGLALLWAIWQPLRSNQADDDAVARPWPRATRPARSPTRRPPSRATRSRPTRCSSGRRSRRAAASRRPRGRRSSRPSGSSRPTRRPGERMAIHLFAV